MRVIGRNSDRKERNFRKTQREEASKARRECRNTVRCVIIKFQSTFAHIKRIV